MMLCLFELLEDYCFKIKLLSLDLQEMIRLGWCQKNREIYSSQLCLKCKAKVNSSCRNGKKGP